MKELSLSSQQETTGGSGALAGLVLIYFISSAFRKWIRVNRIRR